MFMAASAASVRRVPTANRSLATALWRARSRAACSALQHQQPELTRLPNTCRQSCRSKMSTISPVEPRRPEPPHPNPLPFGEREPARPPYASLYNQPEDDAAEEPWHDAKRPGS